MIRLALIGVPLILCGCASTPLATVAADAKITGASVGQVTVDLGPHAPPAPVIETVVQQCTPPAEFLKHFAPLQKIEHRKVYHLSDLLQQSLMDTSAYNALNTAHDGIVEWINAHCAG